MNLDLIRDAILRADWVMSRSNSSRTLLIKGSLSGTRQDRDVGFHHLGFARSKSTRVSLLSRQAGNIMAVIASALARRTTSLLLVDRLRVRSRLSQLNETMLSD